MITQMFGQSTNQNYYPASGSDLTGRHSRLIDSDVTEGVADSMSAIQAPKP